MSAIPLLVQKTKDFEVNSNAVSAPSAAFLTIGGIVVLASSLICLTLCDAQEGVNVLIKGVTPSCCAIVGSIPLWVVAVQKESRRRTIRKEILQIFLKAVCQNEFERSLRTQTRGNKEKCICAKAIPDYWTGSFRNEIVMQALKKIGKEKKGDTFPLVQQSLTRLMKKRMK